MFSSLLLSNDRESSQQDHSGPSEDADVLFRFISRANDNSSPTLLNQFTIGNQTIHDKLTRTRSILLFMVFTRTDKNSANKLKEK